MDVFCCWGFFYSLDVFCVEWSWLVLFLFWQYFGIFSFCSKQREKKFVSFEEIRIIEFENSTN